MDDVMMWDTDTNPERACVCPYEGTCSEFSSQFVDLYTLYRLGFSSSTPFSSSSVLFRSGVWVDERPSLISLLHVFAFWTEALITYALAHSIHVDALCPGYDPYKYTILYKYILTIYFDNSLHHFSSNYTHKIPIIKNSSVNMYTCLTIIEK